MKNDTHNTNNSGNSDEHSRFSEGAREVRLYENNPRLTAYALGEMDASERTAFEAEINLRDNPSAQAAIAEIRATAAQLEAVFAAEPALVGASLAPEEDWRAGREAEARECRKNDPYSKKRYRFPYILVSGLAGALFTVLFFTVIKPHWHDTRVEYDRNLSSGTTVINGKTYAALPLAGSGQPTVTEPEMPPVPNVGIVVTQTNAMPATAAPASIIDAGMTIVTATMNPPGLAPAQSSPGSKGIGGVSTMLSGSVNQSGNSGLITQQTTPHANGDVVVMEKFTVTASRQGNALGIEGKASVGASSGVFAVNGAAVVLNSRLGGHAAWNSGNPEKYFYYDATALASSADMVIVGGMLGAGHPTPQYHASESYARIHDNKFQRVVENPLSTFSIDVDSASYTNVRRFLNQGRLPPPDAVRIEEMVNYFTYNYAPPPAKSATPFAATMEVTAAPWNPEHRLVRIGIKGRELDNAARPPANLVFLIDVSGSMDEPNKLPLVKESMRMLINKLRPDDRIAIVTYSGTIETPLESTPVAQKRAILDALDNLRASGGTNGGAGIQRAYEIAKANFNKEGANRVILCTDGDFNIGITNRTELTRMIEEKAKSGVFLTVLGYGMGNYKDATLQQLADKGNGNHGYIDTRDEARRLLAEQTLGTLVTIAKDVKLQVEFNPAQAESYRLIGYENRVLAKEDFNNDKVDAGEIGAGHTVTALYEVVPANARRPDGSPVVDALKYQVAPPAPTRMELGNELLTLKIRWKAPLGDISDKVEFVLEDKGADFDAASSDFKFATAVAGFGMLLRDSPAKGETTYGSVLAWAESGVISANDTDGRRAEFLDLVRRAKQIARN